MNICVEESNYKDDMKVSGDGRGRDDRPFFASSALKYEASARKEPQKQNSTFSILDLEGALSMKYLLKIAKREKKNPIFSLLFLNIYFRKNSIPSIMLIPSVLEEFRPVVCLVNP